MKFIEGGAISLAGEAIVSRKLKKHRGSLNGKFTLKNDVSPEENKKKSPPKQKPKTAWRGERMP